MFSFLENCLAPSVNPFSAKAKWRIKLQNAFDGKRTYTVQSSLGPDFAKKKKPAIFTGVDGRTQTGKWVLFILPLITVLREGLAFFFVKKKKKQTKTDFSYLGMEAVIFVGGVSLGQPATSIPIAAIMGIICGLIIGFFIYEFASRTSKAPSISQINKKYT